jgi:hypothetical protein
MDHTLDTDSLKHLLRLDFTAQHRVLLVVSDDLADALRGTASRHLLTCEPFRELMPSFVVLGTVKGVNFTVCFLQSSVDLDRAYSLELALLIAMISWRFLRCKRNDRLP